MREFALRLHDCIFEGFYGGRRTILLCGKSLNDPDSLRSKLAKAFENHWNYKYIYEIVYPETLFEEILSGPVHLNLLSLENVLVQSVDAVIVIPESLGSAAELGAFTNHHDLRKKVICIQDQQFKKDRSFINYGPLRLLRDEKVGAIITIDPSHIGESLSQIDDFVGKIRRETQSKTFRINAINSNQFILPGIYLLEPVDKSTLISLVSDASSVNTKDASAIVAAGLAVLGKQGMIERTPVAYQYSDRSATEIADGYKLSAKGMDQFRPSATRRLSKSARFHIKVLDQLRAEVVNLTCRKRPMKIRINSN